jgi:hypothetical protein
LAGRVLKTLFGGRSGWELRDAMNERFLRIYLRDHHAASAGGVAVAGRALGRYHPLAKQIAHDRTSLENVMRQLGVEPSALKVGFVRAAERIGRLKLNGKILKRSPLSRVVELETLVVGVRGKEALWTTLREAQLSLRGIDLDALVESAREQGRELDELRVGAAARAFAFGRTVRSNVERTSAHA